MQRTLIKDLKNYIGKEVHVCGWVSIRRDHGKLIFIDLRDETGKVQVVILPQHLEAHEIAKESRPEWVIEIFGNVKKRTPNTVNLDELNGDIEIEVISFLIRNKAVTPQFDISGDGMDIDEEVRLKYRYIDLRRKRMQKNIRNRHKLILAIRQFLDNEGFVEIETPDLTRSTPEGSRDYIVPSRMEPGKFYALPQSPQQYKQILMCSGFEKYFQFARCFRDEDTRGDRQPEFTQLDLEMSFTTEEEVMQLNEKLIIETIQKNYPQKNIQDIPFPKITYKEAIEKHRCDKPDIRKDKNDPNLLAFCWILDFPFFKKTDDGNWTFSHNPFSAPKKEHVEWLKAGKNIANITAAQYDIVLNGFEVGGGSIRNHEPEMLSSVFKVMGYKKERIEKNFGQILTALGSGAPPHGGIAWGMDRLIMILENEPNIREVIAFAKTGEGRDLMMGAPAEIEQRQLKELYIKIEKPPDSIS